VKLGGREVARTDAAGVAHLAMRMMPNTTFRLQIDTAARPDLAPQSPGATFTVPDTDEVFLYDQPFEVRRAKRRGRARRVEQPTVMFPTRIQ
jgi:hypothetical protein